MDEIENVEKLIELFGRYPSFHDAEIISIKLERGIDKAKQNSSLAAKIRIFQIIERSQKTEKVFTRRKNFDINFLFSDIVLLQLDSFNHQNVFNDLIVTRLVSNEIEKHRFLIKLESIFGCEALLKCNEIKIVQIEQFETEDEMFVPSLETIQRVKVARNNQRYKTTNGNSTRTSSADSN